MMRILRNLLFLLALPVFANEEDLIGRSVVRLVEKTSTGYSSLCSGVLTDEMEVSTAGHCFFSANGEKSKAAKEGRIFAEIRTRAADGKFKKEYIQITAVAGENGMGNPNGRDLSLARLARPVDKGEVTPLSVAPCDDKNRIVAGYGVDGNGKLKLMNYTVESNPELQARAADPNAKDKDHEMQRGYENKWDMMKSVRGNACGGDSGGGIFCKSHGKLALAGIVSYGSKVENVKDLDEYDPESGEITIPTENFPKWTAKGVCKLFPYLISSKISTSVDALQRWQRDLRGPDGQRPSSTSY